MSAIEPNMSTVQPELSATEPEMSSTAPELSTTKHEMSTIEPETAEISNPEPETGEYSLKSVWMGEDANTENMEDSCTAVGNLTADSGKQTFFQGYILCKSTTC